MLRKSSWKKGLATECLQSIVSLAASIKIQRLYAYCHHEHRASARVMEKCGFIHEGRLRNHLVFPNIAPSKPTDVMLYARIPNVDQVEEQ